VARKKSRLRLRLRLQHLPLKPHLQRPLHLPRKPHLQPQPLQQHLLKKRKTKRSNPSFATRKTGALSAGFFIDGRL
jgi:hypothetical protein